ncbi:unnamed protein product [Hymenolepis diminuta]|uniref:WAC n=1 Tax=Hymenolepis diminuta TaxID=6216 RepID=A0A0R3SUM3_HYMDI|nr:unnamed protein product [Hymenolepis diminuta]VUZ55775.1 unnamed protein product [Hymenolepis diminuta]
MSVPCTPGWNDPPILGLPENNTSSTSSTSRRRARVYHSVDGVGAAGASPHQHPSAMHPAALTVAAGSVPPILSSQPVVNPYSTMGAALTQQQPMTSLPMSAYAASPMSQNTLPMMEPPIQPVLGMSNPPLNYDAPSTISRLAAQVNKVLGDTTLEIPSRESIIASISSLQTELSLNRISASASELVKQFISFLELRDFKQAENTLNAIKQQSEVSTMYHATNLIEAYLSNISS